MLPTTAHVEFDFFHQISERVAMPIPTEIVHQRMPVQVV